MLEQHSLGKIRYIKEALDGSKCTKNIDQSTIHVDNWMSCIHELIKFTMHASTHQRLVKSEPVSWIARKGESDRPINVCVGRKIAECEKGVEGTGILLFF